MDKFFCNDHWNTEPHGDAPTFLDVGDRAHERVPEGVTCSFCDKPATHQAEHTPPPVVEEKPTRKSMRP